MKSRYSTLSLTFFAATACASSSLQQARTPGREPLPASHCEQLIREAPNSTFVMLYVESSTLVGCNIERARTRFLPASTFKVPHALIALETGVADGPNAVIEWDGAQRAVAAWNKDASLQSALRDSAVWYYQKIARRIGHERMKDWVKRLDYGNLKIGDPQNLTSFWLDGDLRISALEQIDFLNQLRRRSLPASVRNQEIVSSMMENLDEGMATRLYAKTGLVLPIDPNTGDISSEREVADRLEGATRVGWYVGWASRPPKEGGDVVFALNLDIVERGYAGKRAPLARMMLEANGVALNDPAAD